MPSPTCLVFNLNPILMTGILVMLLAVPVVSADSAMPGSFASTQAGPALTYDCSPAREIPQPECLALVALYHDTNGAGWTHSNGCAGNQYAV